MPLGGCANACVRFFLPRCARGGCKRSETELAQFTFARCAVGRLRESLREFFLASLC